MLIFSILPLLVAAGAFWILTLYVGADEAGHILTALLTPVIAIAVARISYQEHIVRRATERREVFDKRMQLFSSLHKFLWTFQQHGPNVDHEVVRQFCRYDILEAYFLFPSDEMTAFFNEIQDKAWTALKKTQVEESHEALEWLISLLDGNELVRRFRADMSVRPL